MSKLLGRVVTVHDNYHQAIPVCGVIVGENIADEPKRGRYQVELTTTNNPKDYPIGSKHWYLKGQCEVHPDHEKEVETVEKQKEYTLAEVIKLAQSGKKFVASIGLISSSEKEILSATVWSQDLILGMWTVDFKPEVVEFECEFKYHSVMNLIYPTSSKHLLNNLKPLIGRKWKCVLTEVIE